MRRRLLATPALGVTLALVAGCGLFTPQQTITLTADAMACYQAIQAATPAASTLQNVETGTIVLASNPACQALSLSAAELVASALNAGVTPAVAPVSASAMGARAK